MVGVVTRRSMSPELDWVSARRGRFTIRDVAGLAAVPPSSIHHYRRLGLLPEPARSAPNRFLYDERHVAALRVIRRLRQHDVSLDGIRAALPHLVDVREEQLDDAIEVYLHGCEPGPSPRAKLIDAAIVVFGVHGYGDVSIADLCERADVGKGTFYRYFDGKDTLFLAAAHEVADRLVGAFTASLQEDPEQNEATVLAAYLRHGLPLLLELARRALQDPGPMAPAAAGLFADLVDRLGRVTGHRDRAAEAGGLLVMLAVVDIFTDLIEPLIPARAQ
jgi:AcrR family transcriptional regulator